MYTVLLLVCSVFHGINEIKSHSSVHTSPWRNTIRILRILFFLKNVRILTYFGVNVSEK